MAEVLNAYNWQSYVGDGVGIWVSIEQQELMLISNKQNVKQYQCSTAAAGAADPRGTTRRVRQDPLPVRNSTGPPRVG